MASLQISAWSPCARFKSLSGCCSSASKSVTRMNMPHQYSNLQLRLDYNTCSSQRCTPVCVFGRGGKPGKGNEGSPWNPLEKIMDRFKKELTVQDVLKEQKRTKQMEFDDGDDDGGDGKGTGGGGDGSGSEEESFAGALNELLQVILAAIGFSFLYYYIINGEEFSRLVRDYIRYLFGGRKSVRLTRALDRWETFLEKLNSDTRPRPDWLEREILSTPTWWHDPEWQQPTLRRRASF